MRSKLRKRWVSLCMQWCCAVLLALAAAAVQPAKAQHSFSSLTEKVNIAYEVTNAAVVLASLQQQTSYTFTYDNTILKGVVVKNMVLRDAALGVALRWLQDNCGLKFSVTGNKNIGVMKLAKPVTGTGRLDGQVLDEKNGTPVISASIVINNQTLVSDVEGRFHQSLPPGRYTAAITSIGYKGKRIADILIKEGETLSLDVVLSPASGTLSGVLVTSSLRRETAAALYTRQKNNLAISDGISAEQIKATPDNTAAQVLRRVSGVIVQNDKFVTIRGVSDRYNNVLINGAMLPSTEPNRRNFSFDIVPSALIDNIVINKSASPDMPAEFAGGFIQINTRDVPEKNMLAVTVGSGFNSVSSGKMLVDHERSSSNYAGFFSKDKQWFGTVLKPREYITRLFQKDTAYLAKTGARIPGRWQYYRYPYKPVMNVQLTGGMVKRFRQTNSVGFSAALTYRNEQFAEEGEKRSIENFNFHTQRFRFNTALGGLFNLAYKSQNHKLAFKNLYNRRFTSQFDLDEGEAYNQSATQRRSASNTLVNELVQTRLEGEHAVAKGIMKLDWYADFNRLNRDQPDSRYIVGNVTGGGYSYNLVDPLILWGGLYASRLQERRKNAGINISHFFNLLGEKQMLKYGYAYSWRAADYEGTGFRMLSTDGNWAQQQTGLPYYEIASIPNFQQYKLYYEPVYPNTSTTGDEYHGRQKLQAGYIMGDFHLLKKIRLSGGLRYELNKININTVYMLSRGFDSSLNGNQPDEKSWLPSVNLTYSITPKLNMRLAYGKTLARPDFAERTPFTYFDFPEQLYVSGDNGIKTTRINNYDWRVEFYPGGGEVISGSLFYKKFFYPVERFFYLGNPNSSVSYRNLDEADVRGFEIDLRKSLGFIADKEWLRRLFVSGNFSYLKGKITTYENQFDSASMQDKRVKIEDNRPVQGLSPYVINAGLNYQGKMMGFNISCNRFGRRIVYGGTYAHIIQYENPRTVVDMQLSFLMMKQKLELRLNAADILNQPFIIYSNAVNKDHGVGDPNNDPKGAAYNPEFDFTNYKASRGANYSINITYKL